MIRVAFIGAGNMAEQHARVLKALDGVKLVGVCSRTRANAEAFAARHAITGVFDDIDALWNGTGAELAIIAVKELGTLAAAERAGAYGWTLFFEKPAGYNLPVAERVRDAAERSGRTAYIGLNRRFYAAALRSRQELEGDSGKRYIHVYDQQSFREARSAGHAETIVRHFMYANSIHTIDYLRQFGRGDIDRVRREGEWLGEDTFLHAATVDFSSGDIGRYEALWNAPGPWACTIATPLVRLEMRPLETLMRQKAGTRRLETVEADPADSRFKAGFLRQAEELLKALRGESSAIPTLADGLDTMRLIQAIYGV